MAKIVYVCAPSKKAINGHIAGGGNVVAVEHIMGQEEHFDLPKMPSGTIVKIYSKFDPDGVPIAKGYGVWNAEKKVLK